MTPDREKVISALHCRAQDLMIDLPACDKCDYQIHMVNRNGCDYRRLCKDSISLLKEQEAKTGHWIDTTNTIGFPRCECSECNSEAGAIWMKYCPNCGAKMEGR